MGSGEILFRTGVYSSSLATQIANGTSSENLPIQWNGWTVVDTIGQTGGVCRPINCYTHPPGSPVWASGITGTALAVAPGGGLIIAAAVFYGNSWGWTSTNGGATWTSLDGSSVAGGFDPKVAIFGSEAILSVRTSSSVVLTTFYLAPDLSTWHSYTFDVTAVSTGVFYLPDESSGVEGVVISTTTGAIVCYDSVDGGRIFAGPYPVANYTALPSNSTVFNSVGSTELTDSYGWPGQLAATAVGGTAFVLYTTAVGGAVVPGTVVSWDGVTRWVGQYLSPASVGSVAFPSLAPSPMGYVYATWIGDNRPTWSIDLAVYSAMGQPIQLPSPLPGTLSSSSPLTVSPPSIALDAWARPFDIWAILPTNNTPGTLRYSGAFLSTLNALTVLTAHVNALEPGDFRSGDPGGLPSEIVANLGDAEYAAERMTGPNGLSYLCLARNDTANLVYTEVSHIQFQYGGYTPSSCGDFAPVVEQTSGTVKDGVEVAPPPNYASGLLAVAMTLGPLAAQSYLTVLTDWAMESLGVPIDASADPLLATSVQSSMLPYVPVSIHLSTTKDNATTSVNIVPTPLDPTTIELQLSSLDPFPDYSKTWTWSSGTCTSVENAVPADLYTNATSEGVSTSMRSSTQLQDLYLTNLTSNGTFAWSETVAAVYTSHVTWTCQNGRFGSYNLFPPDSPIPAVISLSGTGTATTSLRIYGYGAPTNTPLLVTGGKFQYQWRNSMPASASSSLTNINTGATGTNSTPQFLSADSEFPSPAPINGDWYSGGVGVTSQIGTWNSTQQPALSAQEMYWAPALTNSYACTFQYASASTPTISGLGVERLPGGNATVVWNATANGTSWLSFYEIGTGFNLSQTAPAGIPNGVGQWEYSVELHALVPLSWYGITVSTSIVAGCLTYVGTQSTAYVTSTTFSLSAADHPYDSITGSGGGEEITWTLPANLTRFATFLNGSVVYQNLTSDPATVSVPLSNLSQVGSSPTTYGINLTLDPVNTSYRVQVFLNLSVTVYAWSGSHQAADTTFVSQPLTFVYLRDASGDGLTDEEKVMGWDVPLPNVYGAAQQIPGDGTAGSSIVTANPALYSTNGLVGDYVEKEFSLDPNTVDTAGSHMLDTWNLTFAVGSSACPVDFRCWYENGTNPFASLPGGSPAAGDRYLTNLTPSPVAGIYSGDGSPWASTMLWSTSALDAFENLSGVRDALVSDGGWLRAVTGSWNGTHTLTVWGKLSWGANPLAQSTLNDGLVDGAQPNPVSREALQVKITSWTANLKSGNDEAAPFLEVSGTGVNGSTVFYGGYGPAKKGSSVSFSGAYVISAPIVSSSQFAAFNITIVDNASTSGTDLYYPLQFGPVSVDLLGSTGTHTLSRTQGSASLKVSYEVLRVGEAANTLLWAPANNTTLSNLPWGLKRYTAEPDFDLIVLNLSSAVTLTGIAGAEGGWKYSVHLDAGLNNLLVPRGAFLASPLGQALINNTNLSVPIPSGSGVTFHPTDWSGRTETSGSNAPGNPNYIWVFSSTIQNQQNTSNLTGFGGLPQNPAVESGYQSRQVQAVFWVNVTGSGYGGLTSAGAELKDLFGGLVLNASGNRTGNILSVTAELGTLGLPANVRVAMANVTLQNDGAYAAPEYQQPPPSPSFWQSVGDAVWNTLSGIANDVTALVSVVWNAVQAAAAYVSEAASWLSSHLGLSKLASQFVSGLKTLASAMEWAWNQLLEAIRAAAQAILNAIVAPAERGVSAWATSINTPFSAAWNSENSSGVTLAEANAIGSAFGGAPFLISLGIGAAVSVALTCLFAPRLTTEEFLLRPLRR